LPAQPPRLRRHRSAFRGSPSFAGEQVLRRRSLRRRDRAADPDRFGRRIVERRRRASDRRRGERRRRSGRRRERIAPPPADRISAHVRGIVVSGSGLDSRLLPLAVTMHFPILTSILAVPVFGAIVLLFVRDDERNAATIRSVTLIVSGLVFALTLLVWNRFDPASADFQFAEHRPWIPAFGIAYDVGIDGISLFLVVLTAFL